MSKTARMLVDPEAAPISAVIRTAAQAAPMLVVQQRGLVDLAEELGGMEAAAGFLLMIAEELDRPIGVNLETREGASSTTFLAPGHWAPARLAGWVAGHHAELESEFGEVTRVGPNRAARRRRQRGAG